MLKIVYPICCGMDVHKDFFVACIASTNNQGVTTYQSKRFSTFTGDLRRCANWLAEYNCTTGKYWIAIYNILEPTCKIVLAHSKYVKAIRGKKPTRKTRSGLLTSSSMTLFPAVLFLLRIFVSLGIWYATVGNLPTLPPAKKSCTELPYCFQHQAGRRILRCLWQSCNGYYNSAFGKSNRENH